MFRKIKANELKVGDVFTQKGKYLYPHVVTHIDGISENDRLIRVTYDWINKTYGYYVQDCVEVLAKEVEVYRFII